MFGQANPSFTAAITGFVNGDKQSVVSGSPAFTTAAISSSPLGNYPIIPSQGTLKASNYTFKFVDGTLTITKATPAIAWATPEAITYGTKLSSAQLDATSKVAGTFKYTPAAGTLLPVGKDTLSVTFTPTNTTDYTTATATVTLTVNKVIPAIVWATPAAITYGTALSHDWTPRRRWPENSPIPRLPGRSCRWERTPCRPRLHRPTQPTTPRRRPL